MGLKIHRGSGWCSDKHGTDNPGRPDGDPHLARAGMRFLGLDDFQDLRPAILTELNCFHDVFL
ncbi:hypothetical protein QO034_20065 [Sedimentitalea sp. JM2-8]|uniref:Uncharacterized protein n=1 Tax=Sedimentitalea xiamensis TaxID=3050037 RepID=A0ABT7FJR2_9RHOB|nr:hypothetical protein [Sedimentitalea xiamensis]